MERNHYASQKIKNMKELVIIEGKKYYKTVSKFTQLTCELCALPIGKCRMHCLDASSVVNNIYLPIIFIPAE